MMSFRGWIEALERRAESAGRVVRLMSLMTLLTLPACAPGIPREVAPILRGMLLSLGTARGVLRLLALIGGLILLLIGWKIYRAVIALPGFLIGAALGVQLGHSLYESGAVALVGLIVGGLLGALLTLALHDMAVFGVGAVGGIFITRSLWEAFADTPVSTLAIILGAIVGGLALFAMSKLWMMVLSAAIGATMIAWGVQDGLSVMAALFLVGLAVQYLLSRVLREDAFRGSSSNR
jgi:hypothetical protein